MFERLEVRKPQALKELHGDCYIVICNIYYCKIEAHLCEMEIENIGHFNDEYMLSFHFDHLDS